MTHELAAAIDRLYKTFEIYRRPPSFLGCGCCWRNGVPEPDTLGIRHLGGTVRVTSPGGRFSPRDASKKQLNEIADQVPHLGGNVDVLRHYLPRLLEIAITTGFDWPSTESLIHRLSYGPASNSTPVGQWPPAERKALHDFFAAAWSALLSKPPDESFDVASDTLLCASSGAMADVRPLLSHWLTFADPHAAQHLARFLIYNDEVGSGRLSNPSWSADKWPLVNNLRAIVRWTVAGSTRSAVLDAVERARSDDEAIALQSCFDLLDGTDKFAPSPLEHALTTNDFAAVSHLMSQDADPNQLEPITRVPIWQIAFHGGHYAALRKIDRAQLDHDAPNGSPLIVQLIEHGAAPEQITELIHLGADLTATNTQGNTPLGVAAALGLTEVVTAMVKARAQPKLTTAAIAAAVEVARQHGHHDTFARLTGTKRSARPRSSN
jgi:hypothetical protein